MSRDFFGRPIASKGPVVELPGALDIPWPEPKARPVAPWGRGEVSGPPSWIRGDCPPSLFLRSDWDYSPFWVNNRKGRLRD